MRDCIRHGDVFLRPVHTDALPASIVARKSKVILEGEVTGHAHRIVDGDACILDYYEKTWRSNDPVLAASYLHAESPTVITHEEHGPLAVPMGWYEIIRAREFDYAAGLGRRVLD